MAQEVVIRVVATGAEHAARVLAAVGKEGAQLNSVVAGSARQATRELEGLGASARRVFEIFTGINLATVFQQGIAALRDFTLEASKMAREAKTQEAAFLALSTSVGVHGRALADALKSASGDIIDVGDAMRAASRGLIEGLQPQQIVQIMEASRQLAKVFGGDVLTAFNSLTEAIATGNARMLRQVGIVIDADAATKAYAKTLGVEVEQLTAAGRAQAMFLAVMEKAQPVIKAMNGVSNEQNELFQKLAATWKEWQQSVGNVINDAGMSVLQWINQVRARVPEIGGQLQNMAAIWQATGRAALQAIEPVARILADSLLPTLKLAAVAGSAFGVGLTAGFNAIAGPLAYVASILDDLSANKWPSHTRATLEANVAAAEARVALAEAVAGFQRLKDGTVAATDATKKFNAEMGKNRLGAGGTTGGAPSDAELKFIAGLRKQLEILKADDWNKALIPFRHRLDEVTFSSIKLKVEAAQLTEELIELTATGQHAKAIEPIQKAIDGLAESLTTVGMSAREAEIHALTKAMTDALKALPSAVHMSKESLQALALSYATSIVNAKDAKAAHDALVKSLAASDAAYGDIQEALEAVAPEQKRIDDLVKSTRGSFDLLTANLGKTREEVERNNAAWALAGTTFDQLGPSLQKTAADLAKLRIDDADFRSFQAFTDELRVIGTQAHIMGSDFDLAAANLEAVRARMIELIRISKGEFHPEMARVVDEFHRLNEFVQTRELWRDLFGSINEGISQVVKGLQQGTLTWQSFGDIAMHVIQSIAAELTSRLLKRAIEPTIEALISLLSGASGGAAGSPASLQGISAFTGAPSALVSEPTGNGFGSVMSSFSTGASLLSSGASIFQHGATVWSSVVAGWDAGFGGLAGAAEGLITGLDAVGATIGTFGSTMAAVTAAVSIALVAMRNDITDAGKAIISSFYAASAATAIGTGWTGVGLIVAAVLAAIGAILDFTGIFEKASEDWLKFPEKLAETLDKTHVSLEKFGKAMEGAASLENIAQNIVDFRQSIQDEAGVGGFVASTEHLGPFHIPGIPGATGTEHEGGIAFDFGPFIVEMQNAVHQVMEKVRETISVTFANLAERAMPPDVAAAFQAGMLATLRQQFEDLVASPDATIEDVKEFEARLKAVGDLIAVFSGIALQIREIGAVALDVLPPDLAAAVAASADDLRDNLIALGNSGTTTAADLERLEKEVVALAGIANVYQRVNDTIAMLGGSLEEMTAAAIQAARAQRNAADRALQDAKASIAASVGNEEIHAAAAALEQAIIARYELEKRLIADIEATISGLLQGAGASWLQHLGIVIAHEIGQGNTGPLGDFLSMMESIGAQATTTAVKLFAAQSALAAITGAIPSIVSAGMVPLGGTAAFATATASAASPALGTLGNLYADALTAGDLQGALAILGTGAQALQGLAAGMVQGIRQWEQQQEQAARATHARLVRDIETNRDVLITAADAYLETLISDLEATTATQLEGLEAQREAIQRNIDLSREWAQVAESLARYITELRLGPQAPPDPMGQFLLAQELFDAANVAFALNGTPEGAAKVQQSAADLLAAAQLVYTRPSPEYRELFEMVVGELERVQAAAEAFITPEEQAVQQLESINQQIEDLNESTRQQIEDWRRIHADFVTATNDAAQMEIDGLNAQLEGWLRGMHEEAEATVRGINAGLASAMAFLAGEEARLLGALIGAQEELARSITGGRPTIEFQLQAAKDTVHELFQLRSFLQGKLGGEAVAAPPTLQPFATGSLWTPEGPAYLHEGEVVLPRRVADRWRAGEFVGGGGVAVTFAPGSIVVSGVSDPEEAARQAVRQIEDSIRRGPLGKAIREAVRG